MARLLLLSAFLIAVITATAGAVASTSAPDPATATVLTDDLPVVRACFDAPVSSAVAKNFTVVDYDSAQRVAGASVRPLAAASACVDVVFPDGTAVGQDSLLEFAAGAATDGTRQSAPGAAALIGSTLTAGPGITQAPDLVSAKVDAANADRVVYTFDEALDPALALTDPAQRADPARFGLYDPQGQLQTGQSIAALSAGTITVKFAAAVPAGTTRFVTLAGAVRDRRCAAGPALCGTYTDWDQSPAGQTGAAPAGLNTLLSATPAATGSALDLRWSAAITPSTAGAVQLYREDGRPVTGPISLSQADPQVLRASLAGVPDPGSIVLAGVGPSGASGPSGAYGAVPVHAGGQAPGFTDGPDLTGVTQQGTTITYTFDEAVAADFSMASVGELIPDGSSQFTGATGVSADGLSVTAVLPTPMSIAAGIVPPGGLFDATGANASPLGVVVPTLIADPMPTPTATASASTAPTPIATVTARPTPVPTATAAPTSKRRRRTVGATLTALVRHNKRVSGLVIAAAPCLKHRRIVASSAGKPLGTTKTEKHGAFSVKARKLVATRIKVTLQKRVYKRKRVTIVCHKVSLKV